jgi:Bacterial Ig domain/von Willebrand factor type D domain
VSPLGASPLVSISVTGTGFNTTPANNQITFTPVSGAAIAVSATAVTTLSAATGLRRLTLTVPAGLPVGTASLSVLNTATGEKSAGTSLEIIAISLAGVNSGQVGTSNLSVRITGSRNTTFAAGTTRAAFGAGVTVNSTTVESATSVVANISISPTATVGTRAVSVISSTQTAQLLGAFTVLAAAVNHPPVWLPVANPTLSVGTALSVALTATDADGDSLSLTVASLPPFASFSDLGNGTGTLSLHPVQGQAGTYSLTATATDSKGASASFILTVTVTPAANQPPTANAQQLTFVEDTPAQLTLTGADPEGSPLTFSITTPPANGTLSGTPPTLLYTPAADYFGPDTFQFAASDGSLSSQPASVNITVTEVNDPPVLGPDVFTLKVVGTLPTVPPPPPCQMPCGVIYADPHVLTYDQTEYDLQAVGELIATQSTTDDLEIQARLQPIPGQRLVSIAVALAMRVAGHRVGFYRTSTPTGFITRIDGTPVTLSAAPQPLPGGGTIGTYGTGDSAIVTWPDGTHAIVEAVGLYVTTYRFTLEVGLAPGRLGHMVGALGNADGNGSNDLVTRSGQQIAANPPFATFYGTYVNSWRISQAESLFDYDPGKDTAFYTDLTFPDAPATPQTLPADELSLGTNVCAQFNLGSGAVNNACVVDVGITGDADFAKEGAAAQAANLGLSSNAGSTTIGAATTVTITTPGAVAVRTFPGTAGEHLTLGVTGNSIAGATLTVRDPSGSFVASLTVSAATGFHDTFTLPVTGTYTVTVAPSAQLTGSLTFTFGDVPTDTGATAIGRATTVTIGTIGEAPVRSFAATAGQQLTLTVTGNTIAGVELDVRDPSGSFVASLSLSGATGFRDTFTLPVSGMYTITVDPSSQLTGSLTFILGAVPNDTGTTAIGVATRVAIGTIGEVAVRSFTATAGQLVTLTVTDNTIGGAQLTVRDPSGSAVASLSVSGATGFRDTFTLAVAGTYTITVDPNAQLDGELTFILGAVPNDTGTTSIGTPTAVTIGTIGQNAVRSFTATAGQLVTLTVTGNTIAGVELDVRDPSGSFVAALSLSGATGFRDTFTLPVAGTYTVTVDPQGQLTGSLTFVLGNVPTNTGTTAIGTPTTVTIGTAGENAVRSFTATAGQLVTLTVTGNTIAGVELDVRDPSGSFIAALSLSGATGFRDTFTLAVTGTYTITVDPQGQLTGSLTFTLGAVPNDTGTTAIGTPTTVTIGTAGQNAVRSFTATAGQSVSLTVTGNTIAGVELDVRNPSGSIIASLSLSGATGSRSAFVLPVSGTYTITVDPQAQLVGTLTFTLVGN